MTINEEILCRYNDILNREMPMYSLRFGIDNPTDEERFLGVQRELESILKAIACFNVLTTGKSPFEYVMRTKFPDGDIYKELSPYWNPSQIFLTPLNERSRRS